MKSAKREPVSKKLRFDVFKRDLFTCQYCGKTPPNVVLEVDHILPVKSGGTNEINNLITSCFDCNRGKGCTELTTVPNSLDKNIELLSEKEAQYTEYKKLVTKIKKRVAREINEVDEFYTSLYPGWCLTDRFKDITVKTFIENIGVYEVIESMKIAYHKIGTSKNGKDDILKYFCGVCWNKIKEGKTNG